MNISDILAEVKQNYATRLSYQDTGRARLFVRKNNDYRCISDNKFQTKVVFPRLYRFEFSDSLVNSDKQNTLCINEFGCQSSSFACTSDTSFKTALSMMHGISKGASSFIATIMFEELRDMLKERVIDLDFQVLNEQVFCGIDCYRLSTKLGDEIICGKQDKLIRFVKTILPSESGMYITFDFESIVVDQPISSESFRL